jgi:UDP-GlcNAc:undecaprenyl-phosphate/decaprenyl-phosphate GlcNAc-1-phosphate transferase
MKWYYHILLFVIPFLFVVLSTPLFRRWAAKLKIVDQPEQRKVHTREIPYLGGAAILLGVALGWTAAFLMLPDIFVEIKTKIIALIAGGLVIFILGLLDDIKGLKPYMKLIIQVAVASVLYKYGLRISALTNPFGLTIDLGWTSLPLTILWIVGITNAINLIDGLDGLATGVVAITAITLLAVATIHNDAMIALICITCAGASLGFLLYNFYPASIFMGDAGSMFLGYMLASSAIIQSSRKIAVATALLIPIMALAIPIFDTFLAIIRRTRKKAHLFQADREHLHHRLLNLGLSQKQAVILIYYITIYLGFIAFIAAVIPERYAFLNLIVLMMGVFLGMETVKFIEQKLKEKEKETEGSGKSE